MGQRLSTGVQAQLRCCDHAVAPVTSAPTVNCGACHFLGERQRCVWLQCCESTGAIASTRRAGRSGWSSRVPQNMITLFRRCSLETGSEHRALAVVHRTGEARDLGVPIARASGASGAAGFVALCAFVGGGPRPRVWPTVDDRPGAGEELRRRATPRVPRGRAARRAARAAPAEEAHRLGRRSRGAAVARRRRRSSLRRAARGPTGVFAPKLAGGGGGAAEESLLRS